MKRILCILLMTVLLTGCGAEEEGRVAELQELYGGLQGYTAEVKIDVPREAETLHYMLSIVKNGEKLSARVLAPDALKGITAYIDGETLALEYDGVMLDAGAPGSKVSALSCVPLLLGTFPESYVSVQSEESFEGRETLRVCFETDFGGERLLCTVYFAEDGAPLYAEIAEDGKIIVFAEFTNFTFGDILSSDAQANNG